MISPRSTGDNTILNGSQLEQYDRDGFLIVRGLFSVEEVQIIKTFFDSLAESGEPTPYWHPKPGSDSPLERYPRVMFPHRWNAMSKAILLKPQVGAALHQLLDEPAVACQSMYYFKPPQSPGQSLHQDNFYLAVKPGTCIAAWTAIDRAHPDNGGLFLVPGTHRMDIHCPDADDIARMQSTNLVNPPPGMKAVSAVMEPGDTLFFGGSVIHGSGRNKSTTEWRRSFIGHYMPASSTHISRYYLPACGFDGRQVTYNESPAGGPCGYGDETKGIPNTYGVDAIIH